jgi:hypothetical protein
VLQPSTEDDFSQNFKFAAVVVVVGLLLVALGVLLLMRGARGLGGIVLAGGVLGAALYFGLRSFALNVQYGVFSVRTALNVMAALLGTGISVLTLVTVSLLEADFSSRQGRFLLQFLPLLGVAYAIIGAAASLLDRDKALD